MSYSNRRTTTCCAHLAMITAAWVAGTGATARGEMLGINAAGSQVTLQRLEDRGDPLADSASECQPTLRETCSKDAWLHVFGDRMHRAPNELDSKECHPAPEPSSLAIALMGLLGLMRLRKWGR